MRAALLTGSLVAAWLLFGAAAGDAMRGALAGDPCAHAQPVPAALRLPAVVAPGEPVAIERRMLAYLRSYRYRELGWCVDKGVRDTGPYVDHVMYGTHPAVRIYYSPEMIAWLRGGRRGAPADGAVIIKEQYGAKPAAAFAGQGDATLHPTDWTIMVRRGSASHDGWYWSEVWTTMFDGGPPAATAYPNSGFGLYCLRCHASAASAQTFASLENVQGFPGEPLRYRVDDSWRAPAAPAASPAIHAPSEATPTPRPAPLAVQTFPPEALDTNLARAHGAPGFVASAQCMGCHSAAPGKPFGPTMWVGGVDVSEYGEWRWSPMGLAGRDPVFYAQLQSELRYLGTIRPASTGRALQAQIENTCLHCHGAMGQRTYAAEHPGGTFSPGFVFDANPAHPTFHAGGLARDGISCTVCHRAAQPATPRGAQPIAHFLSHEINGDFRVAPDGRVNGPFKDAEIATHPMKQALGITPRYDAYVTSSQLCGSCHTINLPIVDRPPVSTVARAHNVEQATYVEWLNSAYTTEPRRGAKAQSCQDCHMPAGIDDPERGIALSHVASRIALVEDDTYPATTHAALPKDLHVRYREQGYRRHELLGLNAVLLTMFRQHPEVLGVRTTDYMTGSSEGLRNAIAHVVEQAWLKTAQVALRTTVEGRTVVARVEVTNLTGHRFPSGVAFRRAFLDVEARDGDHPAPFFASGATDAQGRIVGADGKPLPSESFATGGDGRQAYQEHYDAAHPIERPEQAEIFEELTQDHDGRFTTSFIRRDREVKDNRILPLGWSRGGPAPGAIPRHFLEATYPRGRAAADPAYGDGKGHAIVVYRIPVPDGVDPARVRVDATLWYQSFSPAFLAERTAPRDAAATRLRALVEHLDLEGTPLEGWKLRIAGASAGG